VPLYEYECEPCGHRFERIQKFADPPIETCPKCGGRVHKLISSPAIQFKGTGWYVTDYAKPAEKTEKTDKDKPAESSSGEAQGPGPKAHDSGPKDSGPKNSGPKNSGPKDSGPKDSGPKDPGPKDPGPRTQD
jgi:putative FmdB family regulatory protein